MENIEMKGCAKFGNMEQRNVELCGEYWCKAMLQNIADIPYRFLSTLTVKLTSAFSRWTRASQRHVFAMP